jgi:TetR/AcrR family transcriptional regulator, transcriptional repressor for nem operon
MRNREETIGIILHEAGILFNSKGYKATSIGHITAASGYTKGAVYRHFKSKEKLEEQALAYLSGVMFEILTKRIKEQNNAGDKLRAVLNYFKSYIGKPPVKGGCPLLNVAIEVDDGSPLLRKKANSILEILKGSIAHILSRGIEFGQIIATVDKNYFATVMVASLEGAIMMSKLSRSDKDIQTIAAHLEKMIREIEV